MVRPHIYSLTLPELQELFHTLGLGTNSSARAQHVFREVYACRGEGLTATRISRRDHAALSEALDFQLPFTIAAREGSPSDGSEKLMLRSQQDQSLVETVLVPERGRLTQCISTQVGCRQGCRFCCTAQLGFKRNLDVHEIVGQVALARTLGLPVSNVVLMGMGEPLDNLDHVLPALHILTDERGLRLSPNKVTLSTVGLLPQLTRFLNESRVACALSLHSPFEEERSRLIPTNLRHPLSSIVSALQSHPERSYFIQYLLMSGVNDSQRHAEGIVQLLRGLKVKINLIPMNERDDSPLLRPDVSSLFRFQQALKELGLVTTVRLSKGRDIQAACGQLVARTKHP